nr:MAG TPA: hypothetical protein [Caudoviricetes sp.]
MKHQAISQNLAEAISYSLMNNYVVDYDGQTFQVKVNDRFTLVVDYQESIVIDNGNEHAYAGGEAFASMPVDRAAYLAGLGLIDALLWFDDSSVLALLCALA